MKPLKQRILAMIALFEGSRGGAINVWDEQYLSVGTLHYAVGMGPGYTFLARIRQLDPAGFRQALGSEFDTATAGGRAVLTAFCRTRVWRKPGLWRARFRELSRLPAYARADAECAEPYFASAIKVAERYGLTTERGLAWAMDRCVQQGGALRPSVNAAFARLAKGEQEFNVMKFLARAYAASANPKYAAVVLARSLTVALGDSRGSGYPGDVDIERDFGIRYSVLWTKQV